MNEFTNLSTTSFLKHFNLSGKTIFISASVKGLGLSMAKALASSGATVYINGRHQETLNYAVKQAQAQGVFLNAYCGDMSTQQAIDELMDFFRRHNRRCDVLINNLGLRLRKDWQQTEFTDMQSLLDANLLAPMYLSQKMIQQMSPGGRIISISSVAGNIARVGDAIYPITKLGIVAMTKSLAVEYAPKNITVNAIAPGAFLTESNQQMAHDPIKGQYMLNRIPMQRWGNPDELNGIIIFLASELSSYMTGQVITIDGGLTALF